MQHSLLSFRTFHSLSTTQTPHLDPSCILLAPSVPSFAENFLHDSPEHYHSLMLRCGLLFPLGGFSLKRLRTGGCYPRYSPHGETSFFLSCTSERWLFFPQGEKGPRLTILPCRKGSRFCERCAPSEQVSSALGRSGPRTVRSPDAPILTCSGPRTLQSPIALAVAAAPAQTSGQSLRSAASVVVRFGFRSFRSLVAPGGSILYICFSFLSVCSHQ